MIGLNSISANGFRYFAQHVGEFKKLDSIIISNSNLADDAIKLLTDCRLSGFVIQANPMFIPNPTHAQLAGIANLPKLESLMISCPIDDSDLKLLSGSGSLKELRILGTKTTPAAIEEFRRFNPACKLIVEN